MNMTKVNRQQPEEKKKLKLVRGDQVTGTAMRKETTKSSTRTKPISARLHATGQTSSRENKQHYTYENGRY